MSDAILAHCDLLRRTADAHPRDAGKLLAEERALPAVRIGDAGECAVLMAGAARVAIKQLGFVAGATLPALRMTLLALHDVLASELRERGRQTADGRPWHLKGDR